MRQFERSDQVRLLAIARRSIETAVGLPASSDKAESPVPPALAVPAAAFVTIHERGELRGCIGLMRFEAPLWLNVRDAARAAGLDDPRFLPVAETELPRLELEISVLDPPVKIARPAEFEVGRHGIVVERGGHRALLLPQVAGEMGWNETQMLDAVCRKANLPHDAWREPTTNLSVFESVCFSE
ncbi:MAG TPA: AmmeMemoRadiSam system protein A [Candidatus Limnocylindrales bacterium]